MGIWVPKDVRRHLVEFSKAPKYLCMAFSSPKCRNYIVSMLCCSECKLQIFGNALLFPHSLSDGVGHS